MAQTADSKSLAKVADGISSLSYLPKEKSSLLASTCWDGSVRLHDTAADNPAVMVHQMDSGPLLSLATPESTCAIATGGLDGSIRLLDIASTTSRLVGRHVESGAACSCLQSMGGENESLLVSASWSKKMVLWDIRSASSVFETDLPGKAFAMDVDQSHQRVVVATSGRRNCFFDIRGGKSDLVLDRESSLKFQTRCVKFFPEGIGIALGSVEGRVGIEFLDEFGIAAPMKRYAFKCHRVNDTVYPVNCITFHPRFRSSFVTGGCDGALFIWDGMNKKKLTTISSFPTSISSVAFNWDGTELAVASSYTFEEGDRDHPQDEILVRKVLDSECQPKRK
ncbi:unnamed protein product [Cylindrotheca closterium]|uniref:Mitotic checkpoint protein bub3 n=1 Tax=Cylindrotheca closterium TaxID=2856 RepID=A0AAD2G4Q0_9STRA|nr:unnamed protein product [Cylindrotheca closterium]